MTAVRRGPSTALPAVLTRAGADGPGVGLLVALLLGVGVLLVLVLKAVTSLRRRHRT